MPPAMKLSDRNHRWNKDIKQSDPDYFESLAEGQSPEYLIIACSDSRVAPEIIFGLEPGEAFVHRNIANQVRPDDNNIQSVLEYGINHLKIKKIIICGHTQCGGIKASTSEQKLAHISDWVAPIKRLSKHSHSIDTLTKSNIAQQVQNVQESSSWQKAFENGREPEIFGYLFDIETGTANRII
jgi:carbonic anhydrase